MIIYFSATGNNKYAASKIAEATNDHIVSITDCLKNNDLSFSLDTNENFGLVIPTYFGGFPKVVIDFLKASNIKLSNNNYVFFVGTYGAEAGNICKEAEKRLAALGKAPDATFTIKMVDNWNPYFDMNDKDYIEIAESEAETTLSKVVGSIVSHSKEKDCGKGMPAITQKIATAYYGMACNTKKFSGNDTCIGCGVCERQCPISAIKITEGKPDWIKSKCTLCLGCVHRCPKNAISYTEKTKGHGQYFNPNVEPDQI